jgi:hypothetical protein
MRTQPVSVRSTAISQACDAAGRILTFTHNGHSTENDRTGSLFTMKRWIYTLVLLASSGNVFGPAAAMEDLPSARDFESHRITSFDPRGGNADYWDIKPGDRLELALPAAAAGQYKLTMNITRADDYGVFQFYLDCEKLGEPVDF